MIGALLRIPFETVRGRMLATLHMRGYTDLVAAHLDVFQYPGPENMRPSELATQTRMSKQALNYLLGQLEDLGYFTREGDSRDQRSKRIHLTRRGRAVISAIRDPSVRSKPNGDTSSDHESSRTYAASSSS